MRWRIADAHAGRRWRKTVTRFEVHPRHGPSDPSPRGARARLLAATGVLLLGVSAAPASAGVTPVSQFSKLGTNTANGSNTAGGATGTADEGDVLRWVLSYRNTTGSTADVDITDPIVGNHAYVPGSLQTPPGLAPQWSTDGGAGWVGTEPVSGTNAVGARGTSVDGSTGLRDIFNAPQHSFNAGRSEGDGWEALFVGPHVWNVHHHRQVAEIPTMLDCHVKATGQSCDGFPAAGYYVSETAGEPFSTGADTMITPSHTNGTTEGARLFFPVGRDGSTSIGVLCADTASRTSCGYTELGHAAFTNDGSRARVAGGARIGNRFFVVGASHGAPVYCYDVTTRASCTEWPSGGVSSDPAYGASDAEGSNRFALEAYGGYLFTSTAEPSAGVVTRNMGCMSAATAAPCPGFPIVGVQDETRASWAGMAPLLDDAGAVTAICAQRGIEQVSTQYGCYDVGTGAFVGPAPFDQMVPGGVGPNNHGSALQIGTRLYFAYVGGGVVTGPVTYTCWDFAADSACQGFVPVDGGPGIRPYTLRQDPDNPDCIWELGDLGVFQVFSATFGGSTSCNAGNAQIELTPAAFYCDGGAGHVTGWDELRVHGVTASQYEALAVTITDADGNPVPGWTNRVFQSDEAPIGISAIPYAGSTRTLKIQVVINWGAHPVVQGAALEATFDGDPPQVCFDTKVGKADCFQTLTIGNQANAVTTAPGGSGDAPDGNDSEHAAFTQAADPIPCDNAAPMCALTAQGRDAWLRPYLEVTARDPVSGIASIEVLDIRNGTVSMPSFTPGTTQPLVVRANGNSSVKPVSMTIRVTDMAGHQTVCDPVTVVVVRDEHRPVELTFEDIPAAERFVHISNGDPGVDSVKVRVNGAKHHVKRLGDGESTTLDVQESMKPGDDNTFSVTVRGAPGSSVVVTIADS